MSLSRRKFLGRSVAGASALASIPAIVSGCVSGSKTTGKSALLNKGNIVLFQGDSITDAGREKEKELPNTARSFGTGYALLAASALLEGSPELGLTIYNRGISGNKVFQLRDRWQKDCIDLRPDLLSILIGVNDYWHFRQDKYDGTPEVYENDYRALLQDTKKQLPDVKLVICEPFSVPGTSAVDETWAAPMSEFRAIAKKMSEEFDTIWVPFQTVFDEAVKVAPGPYWTGDGVHPSMAGAQLMAEAWLKAIK